MSRAALLGGDGAVLDWCQRRILNARVHGDNVRGICPWCGVDEKFGVSISKRVFNCWRASCGVRGKFAFLVAKVDNISVSKARESFGEAPVQRRPGLLSALNREPIEPCFYPLPESTECWNGSSFDTLPDYVVGRITNVRGVCDFHLRICLTGRERDRVILPISCPHGDAWVARDMSGKANAKYLAPEGSAEDFRRLVLRTPNYEPGADLVVVEGGWSALRLYEYGLHAWALLGHELHSEQLPLFFALPATTRVVLMLDPDVKSHKVSRAARRLSLKFGSNLRIAALQNGDPADDGVSKEEVMRAVAQARAWTR